MLRDLAIIPDIFDPSCYSQPDICQFHLKEIKDELLNAALARNLFDGSLTEYFHENTGRWHPKGKELLKKLAIQNRFYKFSSIGAEKPANDIQWAAEAVAGHDRKPLTNGVILSHLNAPSFQKIPVVCSIEQLDSVRWWQNRPISVQVQRRTNEYIKALSLVLNHSNSLMFIDPHLDPSKRSYREFQNILLATRRTPPLPKIEIHRVCYYGSGQKRVEETNENWEMTFRGKLGSALRLIGNNAEVFIWKEFHRRYLISDLIGIFLDNGMDISDNPDDILQMARLDRADRDSILKEFDPAKNQPLHRFTIL